MFRCVFWRFLILMLWLPGMAAGADSVQTQLNLLRAKPGKRAELMQLLQQQSELLSRSQPTAALHLLDEWIQLARQTGNHATQAKAYSSAGAFHARYARFYLALDCYQKAFQHMQAAGLADSSGNLLVSMGSVYFENNLLAPAGNYFQKAAEVFARTGDSLGIALVQLHRGFILKKAGNYDSALACFYKAYDLRKRQGNAYLEAQSFRYISGVYLEMGNPVEALSYMNEALIVLQGDSRGNEETYSLTAGIYELRAECFRRLKLYADARKNLDLAGQVHAEYSYEPEALARIAVAKGQVLLEENKPAEALSEAIAGLNLASQSAYVAGRLGAFDLLANLHERQLQYKEALHYRNLYRSLSDSTQNATLASKFVELQSFVDVYEREQKLKLQDAEIANQNLRQLGLFIIVALSVVLLVVSVLALRRQRQSNRLLTAKNAEISKQQASLAQLNATKDRLFSIIGHDLRNPFNTLINLSELQIEELKNTNSEAANYAKIINDSAIKGFNLLENLLDWSRSQSGKIELKPQPLNLNTAVEHALGVCGASAMAKNITISTRHDGSTAMADANTVQTVLRNLLNNAIKFTPAGGTISLSVQNNGSEVVITVADTGIGLSPQDLGKLFRLDVPNSEIGKNASGKNTGLGLLLCKDFAEKNGGRIWVESEEGKGSCFYVSLPLHTAGNLHRQSEAAPTMPALSLLAADRQLCLSWLSTFKALELYETSELKKCLQQMPAGSPALLHWKKQMEQAVFTSDAKLYTTLLAEMEG